MVSAGGAESERQPLPLVPSRRGSSSRDEAPGLVPRGLEESSEEKVKMGGGCMRRSAVSISSEARKHHI